MQAEVSKLSKADITCPLCNHLSYTAFLKNNYPICDCNHCGHRFVDLDLTQQHVKENYGDDYFFSGGVGYPDYLSMANLLIKRGEFYAHVLAQHMDLGTILDVGAAAGFILKGFENSGWAGDGIEPNATVANYGRDELGLNIHVSTLEDFHPSKEYDVVTMIQVIAHLYDFNRAIQVSTQALQPNGYLLVETWNYDSWIARVLGKNWHEYSPPSVVHWFSPMTLKNQLELRGYRQIATGTPRKYLNTKHLRTFMQYELGKNLLERIVSSILSIPSDDFYFRYPAFDLFWSLFQRK